MPARGWWWNPEAELSQATRAQGDGEGVWYQSRALQTREKQRVHAHAVHRDLLTVLDRGRPHAVDLQRIGDSKRLDSLCGTLETGGHCPDRHDSGIHAGGHCGTI